MGETVTGRLSDEDETKRLALLKALSRADIGDFSSKDGVVSVTLKIPRHYRGVGEPHRDARDNIFLESPEDSGLAVKESFPRRAMCALPRAAAFRRQRVPGL